MKKIILIASVLLLTIACNKNQKAVKLLAGEWEATKIKGEFNGQIIDFVAIGLVDVTYYFDNCELEDDNFCNMSSSTTTALNSTPKVTNELYTIESDGTVMKIKTDSTVKTFKIIELTEDFLKSETVDENNKTVEIELKKK